MAEYTYKDVIIDPEDPRVEIGKEYYAATSIGGALKSANEGKRTLIARLVAVNRDPTRTIITSKPFSFSYLSGTGGDTDFLIRKKEPEKKYVPFDLSKEEDRDYLRGKWIISTSGEYQISGFRSFDGEDGEEWMVATTTVDITPESLCSLWRFDDGSPCGKLAEDEE